MIDMRIKQLFFDRAKVIRAVDKARRAVLSKAGAFIRTAARSSIRKRKGASAPGQPPSSHTGLLKKFIYFGYEPDSDSVVIGPVKLNKPGAAPSVLEHGGKTLIQKRRRGRIVRRQVSIKPRPYMGPALEKEQPKLPKLWAGSVRGG
ncbi:MAG: hypothetical protein KDA54_09025 [Phycisphaerales bacterium]|nr:hypothetical protein [Phycisphaerales bacterium]